MPLKNKIELVGEEFVNANGVTAKVIHVGRKDLNYHHSVVYAVELDAYDAIRYCDEYGMDNERNIQVLFDSAAQSADHLKIDDPIYVSDGHCLHDGKMEWLTRHFAGLDSQGNVTAWADGKTSWTAKGSFSARKAWKFFTDVS